MIRLGFKVKSKSNGRKAVQATGRIHYSVGISVPWLGILASIWEPNLTLCRSTDSRGVFTE